MSQTAAQRQAARRQRLKDNGLVEVRGIFLPADKHSKLKEQAAKLRPRSGK